MSNWYLQTGKDTDVVTSTRVRIARNLSSIPFVIKYNKTEANKIISKINEVLPGLGHKLKLIKLKDIDDLTKMSLIEKHILSPEFVLNKDDIGAILINEEENICIMINEEDHIRIQILSSGLDLENSLNLGIDIDEKLAKLLPYAYNSQYGFLTSCPTNVGTGLKVSVMVHLPALTETGNIRKVLEIANNFEMNIRGVYGEGTDAQGDMYQISNKSSIGITEQEIIKNLNIIVEKIIEQERLARKYLTKNSIELEDKLYRAYGIISNARKLTTLESTKLLSSIKLGVDLGLITELNDAKIKKLDLYTKPSNLQLYLGKKLDEYERNIERANIVKTIIKE